MASYAFPTNNLRRSITGFNGAMPAQMQPPMGAPGIMPPQNVMAQRAGMMPMPPQIGPGQLQAQPMDGGFAPPAGSIATPMPTPGAPGQIPGQPMPPMMPPRPGMWPPRGLPQPPEQDPRMQNFAAQRAMMRF